MASESSLFYSYPPPPCRRAIEKDLYCILKIQELSQRDQRRVAPADDWKWGEWGLKEYKWKGSFLGWFVRFVVSVQETFILPWLLWSAQHKILFSSPFTISIYVSPSPSNLGGQSFRVACLWMWVSGLYPAVLHTTPSSVLEFRTIYGG